MIGAPTFIARSMTLQIFAAYASDSEPPKTVKSWLKTKTVPPVDRAVAGDDAVAEDRVGIAVVAARRDEGVELDEGPGVEQQLDPLARGQLAAGVLLVDPDLAAAERERARASPRAARCAPRSSARALPYRCLCARTVPTRHRSHDTGGVHGRRTAADARSGTYPQNR